MSGCAEAAIIERAELVEALRALVKFGPAGHHLRPIPEEDANERRKFNQAEGRQAYSTVCYDCAAENDILMMGDVTLGEHSHARWEAWAEAFDLLGRVDAENGRSEAHDG